MQCVICGGSAFSIRPCDMNKSPEEKMKNSKYGDCCCLICAFKKSQRLIVARGYEERILKSDSGEKYIVQIPLNNTDVPRKENYTEKAANNFVVLASSSESV